MRLHCEISGTGPDLVVVHGWGMNLGVWQTLRASWRERYRLHLIELPGHGLSDDGGAAAGWVEACLAAAPPTAHWLGWSLGGQLALQAALQAPDRVTGLSLVATTPRFVSAPDWPWAMPVDTFAEFAEALASDPPATLKRFLALQVRGAEAAGQTLRDLRQAVDQRPAARPTGLQAGLALLRDTDLRDRLSQIGCPQQWLFGERDTLVSCALSDWLAATLPAAHIRRVPGAGHAPFLSHPATCLPWLEDMIDGT